MHSAGVGEGGLHSVGILQFSSEYPGKVRKNSLMPASVDSAGDSGVDSAGDSGVDSGVGADGTLHLHAPGSETL